MPLQNNSQRRRWAKFDASSVAFQQLTKERVGKNYGRWTVMSYHGRKYSALVWHCRCECGQEKLIQDAALRTWNPPLCSCEKQAGWSAERLKTNGRTREWIRESLTSLAANPDKAKELLERAEARLPFLSSSYQQRIGEKHGELTILRVWPTLYVTKKHGQPRFIWMAECACTCGETKVLRAHSVFSDNGTRSCGCERNRVKIRHETEDHSVLIGTVVNRYTILEMVFRDGRSMVRCRCECGAETYQRLAHILSGKRQGCRCVVGKLGRERGSKRDEKLIGSIYGRLTVLAIVREHGQRVTARVRCECGRIKAVNLGSMRSGETRSCGCLAREAFHRVITKHGLCRTPEYARAKAHERHARKIAAGGKYTAADVFALYEKQNGLCNNPFCQKPLPTNYHVDHVQPLVKGGTNDKSNLQLLCVRCNTVKRDRSVYDWLYLFKRNGGKRYRTRREQVQAATAEKTNRVSNRVTAPDGPKQKPLRVARNIARNE